VSAVIDHRPQQRQLQPPPQPRQRRDPAPSRLQYRLERVWLKPLYRRVIRVGVPAFLIAIHWPRLRAAPGRAERRFSGAGRGRRSRATARPRAGKTQPWLRVLGGKSINLT